MFSQTVLIATQNNVSDLLTNNMLNVVIQIIIIQNFELKLWLKKIFSIYCNTTYTKIKKTNMISLLHKSTIKNYDVLTIQKSWKNFKIMMFLNASRFDFYLMYKLNVNIKMCFYINQNINSQKWKIKHFSLNMNTFKLKLWSELMTKMIHIHNVYNSSSMSYVFTDSSFMLLMIERQLQTDVKHVLMKNFNLHHSLWCDSSRFMQHTMTINC